MGKVLVTGCAGFIGSHTVEALLERGYDVVGLDSFSDYYSIKQKEDNLKGLLNNDTFRFVKMDLNAVSSEILDRVEYVIHIAGQGGVRKSWEKFDAYVKDNILATQKLLDVCKNLPVKKLVYASSSSVYGNAELPFREDVVPRPISPYGITKLAAENLCVAYQANFSLPVACLRYFTVYGPRQRPDMAFHIFIKSLLEGGKLEIFGSGNQTRNFTYVTDIVNANILAMESGETGIFNIGGGSRVSLNDALELMENITGKKAKIENTGEEKGDVKHTEADTSKAKKAFGYNPAVEIHEGLRKEIEWVGKNVIKE